MATSRGHTPNDRFNLVVSGMGDVGKDDYVKSLSSCYNEVLAQVLKSNHKAPDKSGWLDVDVTANGGKTKFYLSVSDTAGQVFNINVHKRKKLFNNQTVITNGKRIDGLILMGDDRKNSYHEDIMGKVLENASRLGYSLVTATGDMNVDKPLPVVVLTNKAGVDPSDFRYAFKPSTARAIKIPHEQNFPHWKVSSEHLIAYKGDRFHPSYPNEVLPLDPVSVPFLDPIQYFLRRWLNDDGLQLDPATPITREQLWAIDKVQTARDLDLSPEEDSEYCRALAILLRNN